MPVLSRKIAMDPTSLVVQHDEHFGYFVKCINITVKLFSLKLQQQASLRPNG